MPLVNECSWQMMACPEYVLPGFINIQGVDHLERTGRAEEEGG